MSRQFLRWKNHALSALCMVCFSIAGHFTAAQTQAEDPLVWSLAPEKCLMYSAWSGGQEPNAESSNKTERLMAEPEVQTFFRQLKQRITQLPAMALRNESAVKQAAARALAP